MHFEWQQYNFKNHYVELLPFRTSWTNLVKATKEVAAARAAVVRG